MEVEKFFGSRYSGSKAFTQQDVSSANATGFTAAADDYMERGIDLNEQLIRNKPATFFMRVSGNSMVNAGIYHGDIVIVDRSLTPQNGKIVIAVIDGEMLIRRYEKTINRLRLVPETARLSPIEVSEFCDFKIWGVVIYIIRNV
ncbi:MAG: translesion error-prone DNA polymerase V autoproteolytic subunit [Ferruginibacter sp.]|nr:translesion error-prone DNA polymerase V autoproteolytic subunit [Bacteroidota bacterium]MBX2918405.1 translesion error-prone DNA polymerase V autoproteolytic subunit [Ferruginibacter sp.]MCB0709931.1 translesion error-prone DNA polymerase V autoproteolytic subunit [Chitinophagaceae bacterium]MCC7378019.1 translesion error-prone DNA polymerase V autoproteolytic subunit [Chitinophagaceae bacterium]